MEIIEDKIWIHRDGTEDGIVNDLLDLDVPKDKIFLGFYHPTQRPYSVERDQFPISEDDRLVYD